MKRLMLLITFSGCLQAFSQPIEKIYKIEKNYLNFPIEKKISTLHMQMFVEDEMVLASSELRICETEPDYWVFKDVSAYKGKNLKIIFSKDVKGIDKIRQTDEFVGEDIVYKEVNRPQVHFSTRRGWINDPVGLVWHDGEYHLFYQHNPYSIYWGNMHWGHAVSKDLMHWEELNDVLYPDTLGPMFSGSSVIDKNNTAGFGKDAMVAIYTAAGALCGQCLAYSHDNGRTFTKYEKNPVLITIEKKGVWSALNPRDPKVFWYEPGNHWVMALYQNNYIAIYTSDNLKDWEYQSKTPGFYECPELFELPVDGNKKNKKWVMYSASGTYMIGSFDGKRFTPEAGQYFYAWGHKDARLQQGDQYAGQTYNNAPDGRRIQFKFGLITPKDMPFNTIMSFPTEMSLRTTPEGVRLFCNPIVEIEQLHKRSYKWTNLSGKEANEKLDSIKSDYLHVKFDIEVKKAYWFKLNFRGNTIINFDGNWNKFNGAPYSGDYQNPFHHQVELIIDKVSLEVFIGNGRLVISDNIEEPKAIEGLKFFSVEGDGSFIQLKNLEVHELKSIW